MDKVGVLNANRMPLRAHEDILVFYKTPAIYNPQKTKVAMKRVKGKSSVKSSNYGKYKETCYSSTERHPISVLTFPKDTNTSALHPTQKPVALFERLIKSYTNPGGIVLDNCAGSGTTGISCFNTNRKYILMEKDKAYFDKAKKRLKDHEQQLRLAL